MLEEGPTPHKIRRVTDSVKHTPSPTSHSVDVSNGTKVMFVNGTPPGHPAYDSSSQPHTLYSTTPQRSD